MLNSKGGERATTVVDWPVAKEIRRLPQAGACLVAHLLCVSSLRATVLKPPISVAPPTCVKLARVLDAIDDSDYFR